jgi:hypothetical protein
MRELTDHKLNGLNDALAIQVTDEPGSGNANHRYDITGFDTDTNPSATLPDGYKASFSRCIILFQNGPLKENVANGISNEALLSIIIDRMRGFQSGPYASNDNADALAHLQAALTALQKRTKDRLARGVEGTMQK